jgi:hypothetical protein
MTSAAAATMPTATRFIWLQTSISTVMQRSGLTRVVPAHTMFIGARGPPRTGFAR